jgi:hypothetical protein
MQLICTFAEDPLATGVTKAKGVKAEAKKNNHAQVIDALRRQQGEL